MNTIRKVIVIVVDYIENNSNSILTCNDEIGK